ncbi:MAG: dihydrolipoamide acetyltransferase, partial [Deinococcus sp.]|nr:dihydrolipoamide acetyltransferase [Deinococcus sp.]
AAWLDNQRLEHVTLIGHSMGGHIALHVAALRPGRVDTLVLACASGLLDGHPVRVALKLPRAMATGRKSFVPRILLDAARAGLPNMWRSTVHLLGDNILEVLPNLNVRTLVIWGARDALVPAQLGRALAAAIPGARYEEIEGAGHVVMVDAPERFNSLVLSFLREGQAQ